MSILLHRRGEGEGLRCGINYDYDKPHTTFEVTFFLPIWIWGKTFHQDFASHDLVFGRIAKTVRFTFRIRHKNYPGNRYVFRYGMDKIHFGRQLRIATEELMDDMNLKFNKEYSTRYHLFLEKGIS